VHRPFGEQFQDGGTHVTAFAATASVTGSAATATATARAESGAEARTEPGTEARAEFAGAKRTAAVITEVITQFAARFPAVFAQVAMGCRAEAEGRAACRAETGLHTEGAVGWGEWGVHEMSPQ